jgi:exonuclease SbcC
MLPEELSLKGFLSYKQKETLDFTKFHVALISGDNGQGKSSLLEAMVFALYGIARGVGKNRSGINDLVSDGADSLEVAFRFRQGGKTYRVVRTFNRAKNSSDVRLELLKGDGFVNLSEGSIRETDSMIKDILGMDYDAFVTSSFIMQGRADFFTRKKESEKIEILRQILGLELYENARNLANDKMRLISQQIEVQRDELSAIEEAIAQKELLENTREAVLKKKKELLKNKAALDSELEELQKSVTHLNVLRESLKNSTRVFNDTNKKLSSKRERLAALKEKHKHFEDVLKNEAEILEGYDAFLKAREKLTDLLDKKSLVEQKKRKKEALESRIAKERALINSKIENAQSVARENKSLIEKKQGEIKALKPEIAELQKTADTLQKEIADAEHMLSELEEKIERMRADLQEKNKAVSEINRIKSLEQERKESLEKAVTAIEMRIKQIEEEAEKIRKKFPLSYEEINGKVEAVSAEIDALSKKKESLLNSLAKSEKDLEFTEKAAKETEEKKALLSNGESRCPLCGSPLTKEHLEELNIKFDGEIRELQGKRDALYANIKQIKKDVKDVEQKIEKLLKEKNALEKDREKAAKFNEKLASLDEQVKSLSAEKEKQLSEKEFLSDEEKNLLKTYSDMVNQININADDLKALEKEHKSLALKRAALQKKSSGILSTLSAKKEALKNTEEQIADADKKRASAEKEFERLSAVLADANFMKSEKMEIAEIEKSILNINFSEDELKETNKKVEELKIYREQYSALTEARSHISEIKEQIEETEKEIAQLSEELEKLNTEIGRLNAEIKGLKDAEENLYRKKAEKSALDEEIKKIVSEEAKLTEKLSEIERKEKRLKELKGEIAEKEEAVQILAACKKMFGKEGIQISIIRDAVPRIESIANEMLSKMTNGRMSLKFDTLKQLKTRDVSKNTLQISVYDNGEKRRYELFSGGEQFRINLAIRIGISMFLSESSGMPLEMLVIDEGFGSQDENGKMRILEEINSFKERFKKIIIITHVTEIKENFPYEIRVVKDETGSHITVA